MPRPLRPGPACARRMAAPLLLLLLHFQVLLRPGAAEPGGGRVPWPSSAPGPESRAVSCLAAAPSLAWYLDGERQETPDEDHDGAAAAASRDSSRAAGTVRRLDRRLNCSAVDPSTGQASGASVLLRVHFKAEAVQVEARAVDGSAPGLLLVLLVSVQARPPAEITWVDRDGRLLLNASHFLIVDAKTYPWLGNASVEVQLRSLARNLSRDGGASPLRPGFLGSRIELPLLALVGGATVTLGVLVGLGLLLGCLVYQKGKKAAGLAAPAQWPPSDSSNHPKLQRAQMPRANMSLPSNFKLNDLPEEPKAVAEEEEALSEPENILVLANRGLSQFPMVGYIYRASSVSSEEIWL